MARSMDRIQYVKSTVRGRDGRDGGEIKRSWWLEAECYKEAVS